MYSDSEKGYPMSEVKPEILLAPLDDILGGIETLQHHIKSLMYSGQVDLKVYGDILQAITPMENYFISLKVSVQLTKPK